MTTVLFRLYDTPDRARQIARELLHNGIPRDGIMIVGPADAPGEEVSHHDRNRERKGSFADIDPASHNRNVEREGSFGDRDPSYHSTEREREGSFADTDPVYHDASVEREGSFADTAMERAADENLVTNLTQAGLRQREAEECAAQIRQGAVLLIVRVPDNQAAQAAAMIHQSD